MFLYLLVTHQRVFYMYTESKENLRIACSVSKHSLCQSLISNRSVMVRGKDLRRRLKGHCHGILASFYNAEICSCINGNPKIIMQFCYLGLYHYTETIYCCLTLSMARMEMD